MLSETSFKPAHQRFDAIEHVVQVDREPVELVAGSGHGQSFGEISSHDPLRGLGHGVEALEHAARDEESARKPQHDDERDRAARRGRDDLAHARTLFEVAADEQPEAAGELHHPHQSAVPRDLLVIEPAVDRLGPTAPVEHARRKRVDISGERLAGRRGHQIEARARAQRAVLKRQDQLAQPADRVLLGQPGDFGVDRLGDLFGDEALGVEREIGEQGGGIEGENDEIDQRQPERRRADKLTERRHGSCIRRRAQYAAAAARSPCRSWSATGRYARR